MMRLAIDHPTCSKRYMSDTPRAPVGAKVAALRKRLGLTQEGAAERSGGLIVQGALAKIETGKNMASTVARRKALSAAFGVPQPLLDKYLEGEIDLETLVSGAQKVTPQSARVAETRVERDLAVRAPSDEELPLETALFEVMDRGVFDGRDFDAARGAIRDTATKLDPAADFRVIARGLLVAAKQLRKESEPTTPTAVWSRFATGRSVVMTQPAKDEDDALNAESVERAKAAGYERTDDPMARTAARQERKRQTQE